MKEWKIYQPSRKFILILTPLLVALGTIYFFPRTSRLNFETQAANRAAQVPTVSVLSQQGAPLHISSVTMDSTNPESPEISFSISNISDKPIRAYAIRQDKVTENTRSIALTLANINSLDDVLQPSSSKPVVITGDSYLEPVKSIILMIDFVEFTDNTTWGPDTQNSAERLSGERAGAQAIKAYLLNLTETSSLSEALKDIEGGSVHLNAPSGHSPRWNDGFRMGVDRVRGRLLRANNEGGISKFETELRQPYDASEGRQE